MIGFQGRGTSTRIITIQFKFAAASKNKCIKEIDDCESYSPTGSCGKCETG